MKRRIVRRFLLGMILCLLLSAAVYGAVQERPVSPATSGDNGDQITWSYNTYSKTLTISGSGALELVYSIEPWYTYTDEIQTITINNGITHIGTKILSFHPNLTTVNLPKTLESYSVGAFSGCPKLEKFTVQSGSSYFATDYTGSLYNANLTTLYICPNAYTGTFEVPYTLYNIHSGAFASCDQLECVVLTYRVSSIGEDVFPDSSAFKRISVTYKSEYFTTDSDGTLYDKGKSTLICCPSGYSGSYSMPATVKQIRNRAFDHCDGLTSVTLSDKLSEIPEEAFYHCDNLTEVSFGSGLTKIGDRAFQQCGKLEAVLLPDGVTSIGENAFSDCSAMKTLTLGSALTSMGESAFYGCTRLESVALPEGVTDLESYVFADCTSLKTVDLGESVTSIGNGSFRNCKVLAGIELSETLTSIGTEAFYKTGLTELTIPDSVTKLDQKSFAECSKLKRVTIGDGLTSIPDSAFYFCFNLESLALGSNVTIIGPSAFYYADIRHLRIPDSVKTIDADAFRCCDMLTSICLPNSVTSIASTAFNGCSEIDHIFYGGSEEKHQTLVSKVGYVTFKEAVWHCNSNFSELEFEYTCQYKYGCCRLCDTFFGYERVPENDHSFSEGSCTVCGVPECLMYGTIYKDEPVRILGLKSGVPVPEPLVIPETIEKRTVGSIVDYAFKECDELNYISIPSGVTTIGESAFYKCENLAGVVLHENLESIGKNAFAYCDSLYSIRLPDSLTSLGEAAFYSCDALFRVELGANLTSIGNETFLNCANLYTVHIGGALTEVGKKAFKGCDAIAHISHHGSPEAWAAITFGSDNTALQNAYRHDYCSTSPVELRSVCTGSYTWCAICGKPLHYFSEGGTVHWFEEGVCLVCGVPEYLEYVIHPTACTVTITGFDGSVAEVVIPDTIEGFPVTYIDFQAFAYDEGLEKVTIGNNVTTIDSGAFRGCTNLKEVVLGNQVESIRGSAFQDCVALTTICLPDSVKSIQSAAFRDCDVLVSVTGGKFLESISASAFYDCDSLLGFEGGENLKEIEKYAFYDCDSLLSVAGSENLKEIGQYAFYHCDSLQTVTLPDSLTTIGEYCFQDCDKLENVTFGTGLKNLGTYAFYDCDALTAVVFPGALERICEYTFYSCDSLRYVDTGKVEGWIEFYAFAECSALEELVIGGSTYLRNDAFANCSALKKVTMPTTLEYSDHEVFTGCDAVEEVHITDLAAWCSIHFGTMSATPLCYGGDLYLNGELLVDVVIPEGVTSIGSYAFLNCASIETISLPYGLESIGTSTFQGCSSLQEIYIPNTVTSVGDFAFHYCTSLTYAWGMQGLTAISDGMFDSCSSLVSARVPYGVTSIGAAAYQECSSLVYASIPSTVTSIGERAFDQCERFCHVLFSGSQNTWKKVQIGSGNPLLTIVTFHYGVSEGILWYEIEGALYPRCTICDTYLTERPQCFHDEMRLYDERAATCTEPGYTGDVKCLVCGDIVERGQVSPPLNHPDTRVDGRIEPTCTEPGYSGDTWCYLCDAYVIAGETLEPLNHPEQERVGAYAPTCTEPGYTGDLQCRTCGICLEQGEAIEATGHSETDLQGASEATCTEPGYTGDTYCRDCGELLESGQSIAPLGHRYENGLCIHCGEAEFVEIPFEDVREVDYYATPVLWAVQQGVTNGTSPTEFSPEKPCTRGQIVTFLWRAFGSPEPTSAENPFTDVPETVYYYKAILWAVEQGITTGTSATTFSPEATCTRGQVATFLWRACGKPAPKGSENPFADVPETVYYYQPILWAVENGITNGTGGGKFSPEDSCTRGQIVTFLYRALAKE